MCGDILGRAIVAFRDDSCRSARLEVSSIVDSAFFVIVTLTLLKTFNYNISNLCPLNNLTRFHQHLLTIIPRMTDGGCTSALYHALDDKPDICRPFREPAH